MDDVDDYVPHRPKNYHYDEKTGKIVYHNTPSRSKPDDEEEEEAEYEEIEVPVSKILIIERNTKKFFCIIVHYFQTYLVLIRKVHMRVFL